MATLTEVANRYKLDYQEVFRYLSRHPSSDYKTNFMGNEYIINDAAIERVVTAFNNNKVLEEEKGVLTSIRLAEEAKERAENLKEINKIIVTTTDLKAEYKVISPVYFQLNNRGNQYRYLSSQYEQLIKEIANKGQLSGDNMSALEVVEVLFVSSAATVAHSEFDRAFFIAVQELKERAFKLGADAIVGMRYDLDLDTNGFQYFYMQVYGTAVKLI